MIGNDMWRLQSKLKILNKRLTQWSRESIGDVHDQVRIGEDKIQDPGGARLTTQLQTGKGRDMLNMSDGSICKTQYTDRKLKSNGLKMVNATRSSFTTS